MRTSDIKGLNDQFIQRWSPRSFLNDAIPEQDILALFEAARWSPSCFNAQPWRFVYATDGEQKEALLGALTDSNRAWAQHAPMIAYAFSYNIFDHNDKPNRWAAFDTGAAWMALTLQANHLGYHTHAMGGFDVSSAFDACAIDPEKHTALCALVIGKLDTAERQNIQNPNQKALSKRESLSSIVRKA